MTDSTMTAPRASAASPRDPAIERCLQAAVNDGAAHATMLGSGETYLSACAVFLKASPLQIGILSAFPPLFGAFCQALGVWLMERASGRKRIMVSAAVLQALVWLPIALIPPLLGAPQPAVEALIFFVLCYHGLAGLGNPIWNSLIGDLVPPGERGSYFGYRSKRCGLATFLGLIFAGEVLHLFERRGGHLQAWGFTAIFLAAATARFISAYWLSRYVDVSYDTSPGHRFSFWKFIARVRHSNFAKFVFFVSTVNMAVFIAGPFFALYSLKVIKISYLQYTAIIGMAVAAQYFTLQHWGELSDRFGNKKILNVCAVGVALNPLMWLVSANWLYLTLIQFYSGFLWAGFNLAAANFMFDAVSPPKRARCAAYQAIVNGAFVCIGTLTGAYLAVHLPAGVMPALTWLPVPDSPLLFLFLLSGLLRFAAAAFFLPKVREVRAVEGIRHRELVFRVAQIRPLSGISFTMFGERYSRTLRLLPRRKEPAESDEGPGQGH